MKRLTMFSLIIVFFYGCGKDKPVDGNQSTQIWGISSMEEAYVELGDYAHFIFTEPSGLTIRTNANPVFTHTSIAAYHRENENADLSKGGDFSIGALNLYFNEVEQYYLPEGITEQTANEDMSNILSPMLGTSQTFKLRRDGVEIFAHDLYIPNNINLSINNAVHDATGKYIVDGNLPIEWNADQPNENGLLAVLSWTGSTFGVHASETENQQLERAVLINKDDGSFALPASMFADLPTNAMFQITFFRGSLTKAYTADQSESFQLYALTETARSFIKQ